jgi:hypothetical protein
MARSRDISKVLSSNTTLATDAEVAASYQTKATTGLTLLTPTSIATTGGSGSISSTGTVSFTSASAISLNNVFTSSYRNYKIVLNVNCSIDGTTCFLKLRASATDSSASYYYGLAETSAGGVSAIVNGNNVTTGLFLTKMRNSANARNGADVTLFNPQLAMETNYAVTSGYNNGSIVAGAAGGGAHEVATAYDGFTLLASSGNLTGVVYTFGVAV